MTKPIESKLNKYIDYADRVNSILNGYNNVKNIYVDIKTRLREQKYYFISIGFTDAIFPKVAKHITQNTLEEHNRKNIASTPDSFIFSFRQSDSTMVNINGVSVYVFVTKEENANRTDSGNRFASLNSVSSPSYLEFKCTSKAEFDVVYAWLEELRNDHFTRDTRPKVFVASSWDEWTEFSKIPPRPLDSIILKAGQMERIYADIKLFLDSEKDYHAAGIPYHRGYMLHGPPGTGKTSMLLALASDLRKNICFMSSNSLKTEKAITELFCFIPGNSILVIEDVDTSFAVQDRKLNDATEHERTSLSTMLNAMDGITTPNGMILFMTTNELEVLDDAILRPGRIDVMEKIDYLDEEQLNRMISRFVDHPFQIEGSFDIAAMEITPAAISELFKGCLRNREAIVPEVYNLLEGRIKGVV